MSDTVITDDENYQSGSYTGWISPFGVAKLIEGVNYEESISFANNVSTNAAVMDWEFPNESTASILSFLAIDYGNYRHTSPPSPIASSTLNGIATLTATSDFTLSGDTNDFDVIDDLFLTSVAGGDNPARDEVEVFLHTPAYSRSWISTLRPVGSVATSGVNWNVYASKNPQGVADYVFAPSNDQDLLSRAVDIKSMLQYLVSKEALSGNLFFNGLAFGVETESGGGSLKLSNFSVNYATSAAEFRLTIKLADETGSTVGKDEYTTNPNLRGTANANSTVWLFDGSRCIASVRANAAGLWSYDPKLANGYHDFVARETNVSGAASTDSVAIMLDETPLNLSMETAYASVAGKNGNRSIDAQYSGWTAPGTTVSLRDGTTSLGKVEANTSGYWSYDATGLSMGLHDIVASVDDIYGRTATASGKFAIA